MNFFFTRKYLLKISWQKWLWSCSKFAQMDFKINKFAKFWKLLDFFWKSWKKVDFNFEILLNFKLEIGLFFNLLKKAANILKLGIFIFSELHLSQFWAKSETLFFEEKGLCGENLKKNPKNSQISNLNRIFFLLFLSKIRKLENCENLFILNFIWANSQ